MAHQVYTIGRHVSATTLNANFSPPNLKIALAGSNPDNKISNLAYNEEYYKVLRYSQKSLLRNI